VRQSIAGRQLWLHSGLLALGAPLHRYPLGSARFAGLADLSFEHFLRSNVNRFLMLLSDGKGREENNDTTMSSFTSFYPFLMAEFEARREEGDTAPRHQFPVPYAFLGLMTNDRSRSIAIPA